jgi:hypothetical protein
VKGILLGAVLGVLCWVLIIWGVIILVRAL